MHYVYIYIYNMCNVDIYIKYIICISWGLPKMVIPPYLGVCQKW